MTVPRTSRGTFFRRGADAQLDYGPYVGDAAVESGADIARVDAPPISRGPASRPRSSTPGRVLDSIITSPSPAFAALMGRSVSGRGDAWRKGRRLGRRSLPVMTSYRQVPRARISPRVNESACHAAYSGSQRAGSTDGRRAWANLSAAHFVVEGNGLARSFTTKYARFVADDLNGARAFLAHRFAYDGRAELGRVSPPGAPLRRFTAYAMPAR